MICNSCCHGGADHIIEEVKQTFPGKRVYALIGGLHLYKASDEEVLALAEKIRQTGIEKVYTGHCTGERAVELLKRELNRSISAVGAGEKTSSERVCPGGPDRADTAVEQFYTGMEIEI